MGGQEERQVSEYRKPHKPKGRWFSKMYVEIQLDYNAAPMMYMKISPTDN